MHVAAGAGITVHSFGWKAKIQLGQGLLRVCCRLKPVPVHLQDTFCTAGARVTFNR